MFFFLLLGFIVVFFPSSISSSFPTISTMTSTNCRTGGEGSVAAITMEAMMEDQRRRYERESELLFPQQRAKRADDEEEKEHHKSGRHFQVPESHIRRNKGGNHFHRAAPNPRNGADVKARLQRLLKNKEGGEGGSSTGASGGGSSSSVQNGEDKNS